MDGQGFKPRAGSGIAVVGYAMVPRMNLPENLNLTERGSKIEVASLVLAAAGLLLVLHLGLLAALLSGLLAHQCAQLLASRHRVVRVAGARAVSDPGHLKLVVQRRGRCLFEQNGRRAWPLNSVVRHHVWARKLIAAPIMGIKTW